jgi:anti-sigma regulatory factor (Ser/Thr protein kinase)
VAETRTYKFRSRPEAVSAARQALAGLDALLDAGAFYDASLCVSELVTNAVLHADIGADAELRLDVEIDTGGKLRVEVTDTGRGFTPPAPSTDDDGGWGLFLVDRLSDEWGVDCNDGTCVWFEMSLAGADGARAPEQPEQAGSQRSDDAPDSGVRNRVASRFRVGPQTTG